MKQRKGTVLAQMAKKFAPQLGAKVKLDAEWGMSGQITFKNGRRTYFKYNTLDLNPVGSADVAKDKDYANYFMKSMGYPVVPGSKTFYSDEWAKAIGSKDRKIAHAYAYARKLGFPVIIKPNGGAQGFGVALVHNKQEFYAAMRVAFTSDKIVLVQKPVQGKDYRLVVLDDTVIAVYERIPLNVVGDGRATIAQLLKRKQKALAAAGRDTQIDPDDIRIVQRLKREGMQRNSVPAKGQKVFLLDNANLSAGGDAVDVTEQAHPEFKKMAVQLTKDMGLRLCGVDIMVAGDITEQPKKYWVLEVNAGPGMDHFAKIGKKQAKIVEDLYFKMLSALAKRS